MSHNLSIAADLLVAVLLVATIATSIRLSQRMSRMKADESAMRATITELLVATDSAERAIAGLRAAVSESERTLAERLNAAAFHTRQLAEQAASGQAVLERLGQVAHLTRLPSGRREARGDEALSKAGQGADDHLSTTVLAARDLAARAARRVSGRAA